MPRFNVWGDVVHVDTTYLIVMVGVVLLTTVVALPPLISKRCQTCGTLSFLDTPKCRKCGMVFPDEDA